jgi:protein-S-isoprenylcysteine O-methyltransferase Ste14
MNTKTVFGSLVTLASNPFAKVYARIQVERGHAVVMTGPYRFVRHPFYTGVLAYALALPLLPGVW